MKIGNPFYKKDENGKAYAVLFGEWDEDGIFTHMAECPFCGEKHTHGEGEGHRVAHCDHNKRESVRVKNTDIVLRPEDGYFLINGRRPGEFLKILETRDRDKGISETIHSN